MITQAVLPRWSSLLAASGREDPSSHWAREGDRAWWLARSTYSLALLGRALQARLGRPARMLLPGHFCNQSLDPLRRSGATITFYPVDDQARPVWGVLESAAAQADALVIVHTFGFRNDAAGARALCDRLGCLLIEDAAHVLAPRAGIGEMADAVLYSPHKLLAVPSGAVLLLRPRADEMVPALEEALGSLPAGTAPVGDWLLRRLVQSSPLWPLLSRRRLSGPQDFLDDPPPGRIEGPAGLSSWARGLLAGADLEEIARRRRCNADALWRTVEGRGPWIRYVADGDDDGEAVPYRLVLRCRDAQAAAGLYARLRAAHLPVESWPDLPPEVSADPAGQAGAIGLRRTLVLLPVHQSLKTGELVAAYGGALV
ncbi:hypothetical protein WV31_12850 [Magnetospirillum sp. ME-1]|uniref:DegT/DnrJ/EryC1/StrS family aminotransferase n=1 Tax=Magnetospirillum sp. ME-1 TaxID=1639348 RepID=UPI000A17CE13|nr:DegT/DnrJ/EryC1/StrS family aminotransferase [Magnetospirillum sp. ME-1]ARJ66494.1 hypothetical protein WV31_12850 [Magnetospirillum sp. ME-1]